jgi:hypothetical protein
MHFHTHGVNLEFEHVTSGMHGTNKIITGGDVGDNLPLASRAITTIPKGLLSF